MPFPGYLNVNKTNDVSISLTKVSGRHTLKAGFYNTHSYKAQQRQGWAGHDHVRQRHEQPARHRLRLRQRGARRVLVLQPVLQVRRRQLRLQQHRRLRAGQLEGERPAGRSTTASASCTSSRSTTSSGRRRTSCPTSGPQGQAPVLYLAGCAAHAVHRQQPPGARSAHRTRCSVRTPRWRSARWCRTPATRPTACSCRVTASPRPPTPGRRCSAAPRFGAAYDLTGAAEHRAARRRRALLRSADAATRSIRRCRTRRRSAT